MDEQTSESRTEYPFANTKSLLVVLPNDKVDIEEEIALYQQFAEDAVHPIIPTRDTEDTISIRSHPFSDIWLADNTTPSPRHDEFGPSIVGSSLSHCPFARKVTIEGWTIVGDKGKSPSLSSSKGGYVVYDCCVVTRDGRKIRTHKRYSSFLRLHALLTNALPHHFRPIVPPLPSKSPLSRYRPKFLISRQRQLQDWLSQVLLHPDLGGLQVVKEWVMTME